VFLDTDSYRLLTFYNFYGSLTLFAKSKYVGIPITAVFSCRNDFDTFRQLKQPLPAIIVKEQFLFGYSHKAKKDGR
jgi:hypothetical protein